MKLNTYLNFPGNLEEAFRYYEQHLGAKALGPMMRFSGWRFFRQYVRQFSVAYMLFTWRTSWAGMVGYRRGLAT